MLQLSYKSCLVASLICGYWNPCRITETLGDHAGAAKALSKLQQTELAGAMFEKAAEASQDPDEAAELLREAAQALLASRNFTKCFELALKHPGNKQLFPPKVRCQTNR